MREPAMFCTVLGMSTSTRTLYKLRKQITPRVSGFRILRYSATMETRRKQLGEYVRAAREAQGYTSMPTFAEHSGISPRSVAKVELGEEDAGPKVLRAYARGLGWASNSLIEYLRTGDKAVLAPPTTPEPTPVEPPEAKDDIYARVLRDEVEEEIFLITELSEEARWGRIIRRRKRHSGGDPGSSSLRRTGR